MLMRPHHCGIHRDVPVDPPGGISDGLDLLQQMLPGAIG